jgi:hypothetical protein
MNLLPSGFWFLISGFSDLQQVRSSILAEAGYNNRHREYE